MLTRFFSLQGGDHGGEGEIERIPCRLIVDTGANVTIIRPDNARRMKRQLLYTAPSVSLQTASGDKINVYGKLEENISFGLRVYVADITDPCIIGLEFLKSYAITLNLRKLELQDTGEEVPLFRLDIKDHRSCRILASEGITVPARAEFVAKGFPEARRSFRFGVTDFPGAALIGVSKEVVPVRLANISDGARVIREGEEIATCFAVTSIEQRTGETSAVPMDEIMEQLIGGTQLDRRQKTIARSLIQEFQDDFSSSSKDVG